MTLETRHCDRHGNTQLLTDDVLIFLFFSQYVPGLPDSYAINAIKSSYIPIIESICRSALFGSQQFRRILHMKQTNQEMHHVRKRHSEGSLSIASVLRESPLFTPRHSEPHLPLYRPRNADLADMVRSSSTSPIPR